MKKKEEKKTEYGTISFTKKEKEIIKNHFKVYSEKVNRATLGGFMMSAVNGYMKAICPECKNWVPPRTCLCKTPF